LSRTASANQLVSSDSIDTQSVFGVIRACRLPMIALHLESGQIECANEACCSLLGHSADSLRDRDFVTLLKDPAIESEPINNLIQELRNNNIARRQWSFLNKDGHTVRCELQASMMNMPGQLALVVVRPIETLQDPEKEPPGAQQFRTLFESAPIGILQADQLGIIRRLNDSYLRLIGGDVSAADFVNRVNILDFDVFQRAGIQQHFRDIYDGKFVDFETPIVTSSGRQAHLHYHGAPLRDPEGLITGAIISVVDATERKKT